MVPWTLGSNARKLTFHMLTYSILPSTVSILKRRYDPRGLQQLKIFGVVVAPVQLQRIRAFPAAASLTVEHSATERHIGATSDCF